jgi:hypothetical protein
MSADNDGPVRLSERASLMVWTAFFLGLTCVFAGLLWAAVGCIVGIVLIGAVGFRKERRKREERYER